MKRQDGTVFTSLTLLICDIALLDAAFMVFGINDSAKTFSIGALPWITLAIAEFALYRFFLRRERELPKAAAFLAAGYVVTAAVLYIFFVDFPSALSTVIAFIFWAVPQWRIYASAAAPPTLEKLTARLDMIIVVLLFVLLYIIGTGAPYIRALPCAASLVLCLAALITMRTAMSGADDGGKARGAAALLAFLLLTVMVAAVFLLFASVSFGDAIATGAAALLRGINYIINILARIIAWIASLTPAPDYGVQGASDVIQPSFETSGEPVFTGAGPTVPIVIICAVTGVIAAFIAAAVIRYRRATLGGKKTLRNTARKRRMARVRADYLRRTLNTVKFFVYSVLYRNTPQGVFVRLERWGKVHRRWRAPSETQRSYLLRLSVLAPDFTAPLLSLADTLDACWYGGSTPSKLSRRELIKLRRSFSA